MVFKLFSTSAYTSPEFDLVTLPLELSTTILRMLDPESLVRAASVNRSWSKICRSDIVLRTRITKQLQKQRRERREFLLDPSFGITVVRNHFNNNLFNCINNVNKNIRINTMPTDYVNPSTSYIDRSNVVNGVFRNGRFVGPIRRKKTGSNRRTAPYKIYNLR